MLNSDMIMSAVLTLRRCKVRNFSMIMQEFWQKSALFLIYIKPFSLYGYILQS